MTINNFIPQVWAPALLEAYHANAVVSPTIDHEYDGAAQKGNTVKITSITTPTIVDYAADSRVLTPEVLADSDITLTIDQEKAFGFYVDDVDALQAAGSFEAVTSDSGAAMVEDAESFVLSLMVAHGTSANTDSATVAAAADAYSAVLATRTALAKSKVPYANRYLVCNPDFSQYLLGNDSKLTSVNEAGDDGELRNGLIGRLLGFTVLESPLLNPSVPTCVGYHSNGAGFVSQMDKVEAIRAQDRFDDIVRGLHVYGGKVLRPTSVQVFASAA